MAAAVPPTSACSTPPWRCSTPGATACRSSCSAPPARWAPRRRPWIDWIHTARDQGAIVRNYTKWDDQPASPAATREAIIRATWMANTAPMGPVYINLDAELQEAKLTEPLPPIDVARFMPDATPGASPVLVSEAAALLKGAKSGDRDRPDFTQHGRLERTRCARRALQHQGHHRPQMHHGIPHRPSAACRRAGRQCDDPGGDRGAQGRRRHPRARLCRPQRRAARRLRFRRSETEDHRRQRGLPLCTTAGAWITRHCRRWTCCW